MRALTVMLLLVGVPASAEAFCGFYVGGADSKLFNDATMTVLLRDGTRTVISMQNAYAGPPADFAMVVPVPVVLQQDQVKTLPREVFDRVDQLSAPRLVEYWEQDPCAVGQGRYGTIGHGSGTGSGYGAGGARGGARDRGVTVEAQFTVGEYEIVILSAKDAQGLDGWLRDNNYQIPAGAEPYLKPYVEAGMKFFVARVDVEKVTMKDGRALLSPLRFHYDSDTFSLPVRLGLINSAGTQDLIIHILARGERYEVANYGNVTIPTNLDVAEDARDQFGAFYAALFDQTLAEHPGSVVTEYAWDAGSCDPCPTASGSGLPLADAMTLGADVAPSAVGAGAGVGVGGGGGQGRMASVPQTRLGQFTATGNIDKEMLRRHFRRKMAQFEYCYQKQLTVTPAIAGDVQVDFTVDAKGKVEAASATGVDATVAACVAGVVKSIEFPAPTGGGKVVAKTKLSFSATAGAVGRGPRAGGWTLTRLHVRYGKDSLGEDLIFRVAKPIIGGRELRKDGKLEQSAVPSEGGNNFFQARYAIRHAWAGAIECEKPVRGVWGAKPGESTPETKAARDLATAPRGGVKLASFVVGAEPPAGLVLSPAPASAVKPPVALKTPAADTNKPAAPPAPAEKKGCGCQAGADGGAPSSALLLLLFLVVRAARARRAASRPRG